MMSATDALRTVPGFLRKHSEIGLELVKRVKAIEDADLRESLGEAVNALAAHLEDFADEFVRLLAEECNPDAS